MADVLVSGLSGTEIIDDILAQIKRKLNYSCDLRSTDCYARGYGATIEMHLKLYDADTISVDMNVEVPFTSEPPISSEDDVVTPIEIVEKLEIPQELNLTSVRERMQIGPSPSPPTEEEEARMPKRMKRKYTTRASLEQVTQAQGATVDVDPQF